MPKASIIVPAFNAAQTLPATLHALQSQSARDFEVLIVNDGSTDHTDEIVAPYLNDPRFHLINQPNRGLAGARNSGLNAANGAYVGFCDADDLWSAQKLETHIRHLDRKPHVGVSYSGSLLIDGSGKPLGLTQSPRLKGVTAATVFKRNPIGNGSAAMLRHELICDITYRPRPDEDRQWVFDETFRQSEDIECWLRIALTTDWGFEGVPGALTHYRVAGGGLSAMTERQLASWERMVDKLRPTNPGFFARHEDAARAYQLRYLARRAISAGNGSAARSYLRRAFESSHRPLFEEPKKTMITGVAALLLERFGVNPLHLVQSSGPATGMKGN